MDDHHPPAGGLITRTPGGYIARPAGQPGSRARPRR
jgi:hypothetical protein